MSGRSAGRKPPTPKPITPGQRERMAPLMQFSDALLALRANTLKKRITEDTLELGTIKLVQRERKEQASG